MILLSLVEYENTDWVWIRLLIVQGIVSMVGTSTLGNICFFNAC